MKIDIKLSQADKKELNQIEDIKKQSIQSLNHLRQGDYLGNDFLGWLNLPSSITDQQLTLIENTAKELRQISKIFVVAGIGGSYLGARMVIEALKHNFDYLSQQDSPLIVYAGNTLNEDYMADLLEVLDKYDYSLCVISKSGTTTETAVAFRILREHLEKKYGLNEAVKRIVAITDQSKGVLKLLADKQGYQTFVIPDNVGGRYSVLTPVGLLPIAVAGFDIKALVEGATKMQENLLNEENFDNNIALQYATIRNYLYNIGKSVELLVNYQPNLIYLSEWFKQLFGESEGKEHKGLFPASVCNTTDLHSMGQYIQQGSRLMFETVLHIEHNNKHIQIPYLPNDDDKLNYLQHFSLNDINHKAEEGTRLAHLEGDVSQITISVEKIDAHTIGELIYFFELSCAISGYILNINPFNQPGVENYKNKMFSLLGKPNK